MTTDPSRSSIVQAWRNRVSGNPGRTAVRYFDGSVSAAELDTYADALAAGLQARGVRRGDRVGIYLQNVPYYPLWVVPVLPKTGTGKIQRAALRQQHMQDP